MADDSGSLAYAPTWAVASVCFAFIVFSLIIERLIFAIGQWWIARKQLALVEALEKIKEELMVVGFISLALTVGAKYVIRICVPKEWINILPQCRRPPDILAQQESESSTNLPSGSACVIKGKAEFMHPESLHELHIFIFSLAVVHVVYSVIIMALGRWKVYQWKTWEKLSSEMEIASIPGQLRYTRNSTFVKRHVSGRWSKHVILSYIAAFFQQFFRAVRYTDYVTLRHGFVATHNLDQDFDFHKYIMRSLEYDFQHVVGISPFLWGYLVLLLLLNVEGWGMLYWTSLAPIMIVLLVGTKLRHIITQMAICCLEKHVVIEGIPSVKLSNDHFWFAKPTLILSLIHFVLFQDALEFSFLVWSKLTFTTYNCFNQRHRYLLIGRLLLGLITQILCGYVMLPIYALVSQMGSRLKQHGQMELGVFRLHGHATLVELQKEVSIVVAPDAGLLPSRPVQSCAHCPSTPVTRSDELHNDKLETASHLRQTK